MLNDMRVLKLNFTERSDYVAPQIMSNIIIDVCGLGSSTDTALMLRTIVPVVPQLILLHVFS